MNAMPIMKPTTNWGDLVPRKTPKPKNVKPIERNIDQIAAKEQLFKPLASAWLTCATQIETLNCTMVMAWEMKIKNTEGEKKNVSCCQYFYLLFEIIAA